MKRVTLPWGVLLLAVSLSNFASAQSPTSAQSQSPTAKIVTSDTIPRLIRFSGTMRDASGSPMTGTATMTFALYDAQTGGTLLWSEKQTVQCGDQGHYTVLLGSTQAEGLPMDVFTSRQARWLGITVDTEEVEHERVQLTSTPYALKAADADTLGGKPPSAYMLSPNANSASEQSASPASAGDSRQAAGSTTANIINPNISGTGTKNFVPLWTSTTNLGNSVIFQNSSQNIGVGVTSPNAKFVVKGNGINTRIGDPACGTNFAGLGFGNGTLSCTNYSIMGDSSNTYVNAPSGTLNFRLANSDSIILGKDSFGLGFGAEVIPDTVFDGEVDIGIPDTAYPTALFNVTTYNKTLTTAVSGTATMPNAIGVFGQNDIGSGIGVMGMNLGDSGTIAVAAVAGEACCAVNAIGVMSQASGASSTGIWGSVDSGEGILAENTGSSTFDAALVAINDANSTGNVFEAIGPLNDSCVIDGIGDLFCSGSKSAVVPVDQGQRRVALYAVESPENWFEDFGSGRLLDGAATIRLDATFSQTVNTSMDYHVFLTPGGDCKGLYVKQKTANSFEVHESGGGTSNVGFDYRIVARRKGYETVRMADKSQAWQDLSRMRQRIAQNKPKLLDYAKLAKANAKPARQLKRP